MRNRDVSFLILILLVTGLAAWINFTPADRDGRALWLGRDVATRLGLDLQGGTQVLLRAQPQEGGVTPETMQTAAGVIDRRVNGLGVSESVVQLSGDDRIIVELPGVSNPDQAIETLRGTGKLEFIDTQGQSLAPGTQVKTSGSPNPRPRATTPLSGTDALSATQALSETVQGPIYASITDGADLNTGSVQPSYGGQGRVGANQFAVAFAFNEPSASRLAQFSSQNVQRPMCIVLDNVVFSCPVIQSALVSGSGEITTGTRDDADRIFNQLKYGALPIGFDIESSRTVSASLGAESVRASIVAGVVGLCVVAVFLILYYRLSGVIAVLTLVIYTLLTFAIYKLVPVTLTLAGIAGFILSIGVAVDANVLIFARLKEELRSGKSFSSAAEGGFTKAWSAILDSSIAMIITSVILFAFGNAFGVSIIRGFALTLLMGTIISLITAQVVTRTLLRLVARMPALQKPWLFDLNDADQLAQPRGEAVA